MIVQVKKTKGYFTYQKEAMFPGGSNAWIEYLQKKSSSKCSGKA